MKHKRKLSSDFQHRLVDVGLPPSRSVRLVAYVERTETLVVAAEHTIGENIPVCWLYARHRSEATYRKLFGPDEFTGAGSFAVARATGEILCLVSAHVRAAPRSANMPEIVRLGSEIGRVETALSMARFSDRNAGGWCAEVLEASNDATSVIAKIAIEKPHVRHGRLVGTLAEYSIARVSLADGAYEPIAALPSISF